MSKVCFSKDVKSQKVKKFIENICNNLQEEVISCFNDLGEVPLTYRERAFTSVMFPVIHNSGKRALMEVYYNDGKRNFLDFYVLDNDKSASYLIEFKHGWDNHEKIDIDKFNKDKWPIVNDQLKKLNKKIVNDHIDSNKEIYGISLYMFVSYTEEEINSLYENMNYESYDNKIERAFPGYDWKFNWRLDKDLNEKFKKGYNSTVYPCVTLLGKIKVIDEG